MVLFVHLFIHSLTHSWGAHCPRGSALDDDHEGHLCTYAPAAQVKDISCLPWTCSSLWLASWSVGMLSTVLSSGFSPYSSTICPVDQMFGFWDQVIWEQRFICRVG